MIGKNQMCAIADVQAASNVHTGLGESFDFLDQRGGIDDHSHTDDGVLPGPQNATRNQLQNVFFPANDDGVPSIVATSHADDKIK